jgi:hypothetical protein
MHNAFVYVGMQQYCCGFHLVPLMLAPLILIIQSRQVREIKKRK